MSDETTPSIAPREGESLEEAAQRVATDAVYEARDKPPRGAGTMHDAGVLAAERVLGVAAVFHEQELNAARQGSAPRDGSIILARLIEFPDDHTFLTLTKEALKEGDLPAMCFALGVIEEHDGGSSRTWAALARELKKAVEGRCRL